MAAAGIGAHDSGQFVSGADRSACYGILDTNRAGNWQLVFMGGI